MREHGAALLPEIDAAFRSRPLAEWGERLDAAGCIWAPVLEPFEVVRDPQLRDHGAFERVTDENGASYGVVAAPFAIRGADIRARGAAPRIGAHTHEVLQQYGFSADEIADYAANEVFG
jgi:formyl-CoA transferase